MDISKKFQETLAIAVQEVERDLSLPGNSLVDGTPPPVIIQPKTQFNGTVRLDRNFMVRIDTKHLKHSRELLLRKRLADKEQLINELLCSSSID